MQRRTFLKKSAMGIGTLAGVYGGVLKAEEVIGNPHSVMTAYSSGGGVAPLGESTQLSSSRLGRTCLPSMTCLPTVGILFH